MSNASLAELQSWVGRTKTLHNDMSPFHAQAFAAAINRTDAPGNGDPLPLPWHWLYFLEPTPRDATGEDGHPRKGGFLPPVPLPRRMWAAGTLKIDRPLVLGQSAEKISTITSVEAKEGRSGPLVFVNLKHDLMQDGQLCITEEQNLVYREAPREQVQLPPGEKVSEQPDLTRELNPDPVLLFRYSALTYNAHRIHYDRKFAIDQEFYPALVVQGPLLATLLLQLAYDHCPGASIGHFTFRALRPTFDNHSSSLYCKQNENTLKLWSTDHEGGLCMTAEANIGKAND
ncbi:MAG: acyl-CoA dehydrogenase [Pseudomonadota bacterium]